MAVFAIVLVSVVYLGTDTERANRTPEFNELVSQKEVGFRASQPEPQLIIVNVDRNETLPNTKAASIQFFDGDTVDVKFRRSSETNIAFPESLAVQLDEWKNEAIEGNADVARMIYKSLDLCRQRTYRTDDEFAAAIDQLQQTHVISLTLGGQTAPSYVEPTDDLISDLRKWHEFCRGIGEDDIQAADSWLEMAANNGSVRAQLALGQKMVTKSDGRIYLEMAWLSGSIDAAGWLARSLTAENDEVSKDLIAAYAYQTLYAELVRADFESRGLSSTPHAVSWMEANSRGTLRIESLLAVNELQLAQELAKNLYAGNKSCCLSR